MLAPHAGICRVILIPVSAVPLNPLFFMGFFVFLVQKGGLRVA
ncbi:hypothetical protein CNX72_34075 [Burkholderia pseudomallei]|nr:hypothetical protein CNX72_34075 [Burkholderia pseudomallei]